MKSLKESLVFKFEPGTLEAIRKLYNLEQPGRMDEAVDIIEQWIQKQDHFSNKNFDRDYLERLIISNKGLLERVKTKLDNKCAMLNSSNLFTLPNLSEYKLHLDMMTLALSARQTSDFKRIYTVRFNESRDVSPAVWIESHKIIVIGMEHNLKYDYCTGYHTVLDYRQIHLLDLISTYNLSHGRNFMNIVTGAYGLQIKSIHILTTSKLADAVISIVGQIYPKFKYNIYVHRDLEQLYKYIPKDLLPADYGGKDDTLYDIREKFKSRIFSEEFLEHMKWVFSTKTDESRRPKGQINEEYQGTAGTFRAMAID